MMRWSNNMRFSKLESNWHCESFAMVLWHTGMSGYVKDECLYGGGGCMQVWVCPCMYGVYLIQTCTNMYILDVCA